MPQIDGKTADKIAAAIQRAIEKVLDDAAEEDGTDVVVSSVMQYREHYAADDAGVFVEIVNGTGKAEVGIKVQVLSDHGFVFEGTDE